MTDFGLDSLSPYFGKDGKRLSMRDAIRLAHDPSYRRLAESTLPNGAWVSTVWLGIDHQFGKGPPLIFETMVFLGGDSLDCRRYSTEAEAFAGHSEVVSEWSSKTKEEVERP